MSNLTGLVPPLELCKLIPGGEFADSAFVWIEVEIPQENKKEWRVVNATKPILACHNPKHPAPTLQEIMEKIAEIKGVLNPTVFQQLTGWVVDCAYDPTGEMTEADEPTDDEISRLEIKDCRDKSPVIAAMRLWMKLKGIEDEG